MSSFSGIGGSAIDNSKNAALYNAALGVADSRTIVLDRLAIGVPIFTTTGNLPNGQANDSTDGTHPGPNQIAYTNGVLKAAILAALKARAGLSFLLKRDLDPAANDNAPAFMQRVG